MGVTGFLWCPNWKRKLIDSTFIPLKFPFFKESDNRRCVRTASREIDGWEEDAGLKVLPPPLLPRGLQVCSGNIYPFGIVLAGKACKNFKQRNDII